MSTKKKKKKKKKKDLLECFRVAKIYGHSVAFFAAHSR